MQIKFYVRPLEVILKEFKWPNESRYRQGALHQMHSLISISSKRKCYWWERIYRCTLGKCFARDSGDGDEWWHIGCGWICHLFTREGDISCAMDWFLRMVMSLHFCLMKDRDFWLSSISKLIAVCESNCYDTKDSGQEAY